MRSTLPSLTFRRPVDSRSQGRELTSAERQQLPPGFEAVGEALASGMSAVEACTVAGRALAQDGASLGEALSWLHRTSVLVGGEAPDFRSTEALSVAWSEATLQFLHDLSCEDPLTGLASAAHLRTRMAEIYREADRQALSVGHVEGIHGEDDDGGGTVRESHAFVVVDVTTGETGGSEPPFARALRLAAVADGIRSVFPGEETIARGGASRAIVLTRRTPELGESVAVLRMVLADLDLSAGTRIWIEGLPDRAERGAELLSELLR